MSNNPEFKDVVATVFTVPLKAGIEVEKAYRKEWMKGAKKLASLLDSDDETKNQTLIDAFLNNSPVMSLEGHVEVDFTMRIASFSEGGGGLTLGAGPIGFSGKFSQSSSEESTMSINAKFNLRQGERTLENYLKSKNIDPKKSENYSDGGAILKELDQEGVSPNEPTGG